MKRFMALAFALLALGATAQATVDVAALLEKIVDHVFEESLVGDGDVSVGTYRPSQLSDSFAKARLAKSVDDRECSFDYVKGAEAWNLFFDNSFPAASDDELVSMLKELRNSGEVAEIYVAAWDGASGDSEYCLMHYFDIYTKNGKILELHINETD